MLNVCLKFLRPGALFVGMIGLSAVLAAGSAAYAQECECVVPGTGADGRPTMGSFTKSDGPVQFMGTQGWENALVGTAVPVGARVETGPSGTATIAIGRCILNVDERSRVTFEPREQMLCVATEKTSPISAGALAAIGIGVGAAGAALIAISNGDDDPASLQ